MSEVIENSTESIADLEIEAVNGVEKKSIEEIKSEKKEGHVEVQDKKKFFYTKKVCRFCTKQIDEKDIVYKNVDLLRKYVMPSGKIVPRRINGCCAKHQRRLSEEIKKARIIALLPFLDR